VTDAVRARAAIDEHGLLISEVVGDARGGALGHRLVINPAEAALRRADKILLELSDRLGLSPAARARLGLVANQAALASAEASRLLDQMFTADVINIETKRP
jgi:phage terminase small subunit